MTVTVGDPEKSGEGMGAFITYKITTTTLPSSENPECTVRRRFSDFLGLYFRLVEKYLHAGHIIPPPPEKSVIGMTKVKFSKNEESGAAFIDRRRAALERYLNRLASHPILSKDEILKDFLENPAELSKAMDTSSMSGGGFMRFVQNVGDSLQRMTGKKTNGDVWFEERQEDYETLDDHLRKLHRAIETMISVRKELCSSTSILVKSIAVLSNAEEDNFAAYALSKLSEVQDHVEALHDGQVSKDLFVLGETVKDYVAMLGSIKESFAMRGKSHSMWMSAQKSLAGKRESEQKLVAAGKTEKLPQLKEEISQWEEKDKQCQKAFEEMSKVLRREVMLFEHERMNEFKEKFISYFESLMQMQQELIRLWEGYLPDAQAID